MKCVYDPCDNVGLVVLDKGQSEHQSKWSAARKVTMAMKDADVNDRALWPQECGLPQYPLTENDRKGRKSSHSAVGVRSGHAR
jgi:hypothetical protein